MKEWGLQQIKKRYYFPGVKGGVLHHADCQIFRSLEQYEFCFCSCGLLHDLEKSLCSDSLLEVIYPRYWHDYYLQERGEDSDDETPETKVAKQKEQEECHRILYEIFGPPSCTSLNDIKKDYEENKKLLLKVFGKSFTDVFYHLNERMKKEIEEYRRYEHHKASGLSS